ncbi:hypothetical protein Tco_1152363 [Tanacetum coccineum]
MEITATIDGRVKTVTEASIRRHLKLEDSDGISTLPNTEIFEQLSLMGIYKGYNEVDIPLFSTMLVQGLIFQGEGSTIPVESHHTPTSAPSTSQPPTLPPSMQTTHVAEEAATIPHDSPLPRVYSLGSDEGNMTLHELTVLCTTLSKKVESLESDLNLLFDDLEDSSKQGRKITQFDEDEGITLVQIGAQTQGRHKHDLKPDFEFTAPEEVSTANPEVKTAAKTELVQKKIKLQLEKERLGYEEALRLQEQLDEEERQRIARVHEEASTFNAEEWDNIQA